MSKIILGIHGLGNKPERKLLQRWWKTAIREGLRENGYPWHFVKCKVVCWAHLLYQKPLDPKVRDKKNPLYIDTPYVTATAISKKKPNKVRKKIIDYIHQHAAKIILNENFSINYSSVTDLIIRRYFRDLDIYYTQKIKDQKDFIRPAKEVIGEEVTRIIRKYKRKDILLIGHSMGSILAYDVLTDGAPDITINTLVTMGSPLGLPPIMLKILSEKNKKPHKHMSIKIPNNIIKSWHNFFDPADKISANQKLSDYYKENDRHIRVVDTIVSNNYEYLGKENPHSVYGYLRTPAFAHLLNNFLIAGRSKTFIWLRDKIDRFGMSLRREH
jgi:hypothetical protein